MLGKAARKGGRDPDIQALVFAAKEIDVIDGTAPSGWLFAGLV
jgi:hypothetical protein